MFTLGLRVSANEKLFTINLLKLYDLFLPSVQDWWDSKLPEDSVLCCLSVIPKVLLAGAITLMDEAYFKLAVWLNDRGNLG